MFSGAGDYVGLLGGSGYTVSGSNGSVETFTNTGFNVTGNNDTIGTDVPVGSTAGSTGTITGTGDSLTEGSGGQLQRPEHRGWHRQGRVQRRGVTMSGCLAAAATR